VRQTSAGSFGSYGERSEPWAFPLRISERGVWIERQLVRIMPDTRNLVFGRG
jgi:hypothetical protein